MHNDPPTFYWFIYNPNALTPPTKQFNKVSVAEYVAEALAKKHPGEKFYVMKVEYVSLVEYVPNVGWAKESFNG